MWLSVDTSGEQSVAFEAHDATDDGQTIRVDASWLEARGVQGEPIATYHDGATIPVEPTADGSAYRIEAPHFSHIALTCAGDCLDRSWLNDEGTTFAYEMDVSSSLNQFNTTVYDETTSEVTLSHWTKINGSKEGLWGESFNKTTRESLNRSGYYTHSFINESILDSLEAKLGRANYQLTETTLESYVFTNETENTTYYYDKDTGSLRGIDNGTGESVISGLGTSSDNSAPLLDRRPGYAPITQNYEQYPNSEAWGEAFFDPEASAHGVNNDYHWAGGQPDQVVQMNLLDGETKISALVDYSVYAEVDDRCTPHGADEGCVAHTSVDFCVRWDDEGGGDDKNVGRDCIDPDTYDGRFGVTVRCPYQGRKAGDCGATGTNQDATAREDNYYDKKWGDDSGTADTTTQDAPWDWDAYGTVPNPSIYPDSSGTRGFDVCWDIWIDSDVDDEGEDTTPHEAYEWNCEHEFGWGMTGEIILKPCYLC